MVVTNSQKLLQAYWSSLQRCLFGSLCWKDLLAFDLTTFIGALVINLYLPGFGWILIGWLRSHSKTFKRILSEDSRANLFVLNMGLYLLTLSQFVCSNIDELRRLTALYY